MARLDGNLTQQENLIKLIVNKNPQVAGLTVDDVIFGEPTEDLTLPGGRNTTITVTAKEGTNFVGTLVVKYKRLTVTEAFGIPEGTNNEPAQTQDPTYTLEATTPEIALVQICSKYNIPQGDLTIVDYVAPTLVEPGLIEVSYQSEQTVSTIYAPGPITQNYIKIPIQIDEGNLALAVAELDGFDPYSI